MTLRGLFQFVADGTIHRQEVDFMGGTIAIQGEVTFLVFKCLSLLSLYVWFSQGIYYMKNCIWQYAQINIYLKLISN